jgi:hypothetical protein
MQLFAYIHSQGRPERYLVGGGGGGGEFKNLDPLPFGGSLKNVFPVSDGEGDSTENKTPQQFFQTLVSDNGPSKLVA